MKHKISVLQVYRGFAALMVVLLHLGGSVYDKWGVPVFNNFFHAGWSGVDFFFVLSGFIITYMHWGDVEKRKNLRSYIIKRAIRIYPIYWCMTILFLVTYLLTDRNHLLHAGFSYYLDSLLLIPQQQDPVIRVAWSLCFEIFFYCLFALAIFSGRKIAQILFYAWCIMILLFNFAFPQFLTNGIFSFTLHIYILLFLMGCVIGVLARKTNLHLSLFVFLCGVVLLISNYLLLYYDILTKQDPLTRVLFGISFSSIIYGSIKTERSFRYKNKLIELGDASYVMYLFHLIPVALFAKFYDKILYPGLAHSPFLAIATNLYAIFVVLFIIWTSILLHRHLEKPMVNRLRKIFLGDGGMKPAAV